VPTQKNSRHNKFTYSWRARGVSRSRKRGLGERWMIASSRKGPYPWSARTCPQLPSEHTVSWGGKECTPSVEETCVRVCGVNVMHSHLQDAARGWLMARGREEKVLTLPFMSKMYTALGPADDMANARPVRTARDQLPLPPTVLFASLKNSLTSQSVVSQVSVKFREPLLCEQMTAHQS
jgi:hypothetical protein